jgi:hypothetical protein
MCSILARLLALSAVATAVPASVAELILAMASGPVLLAFQWYPIFTDDHEPTYIVWLPKLHGL